MMSQSELPNREEQGSLSAAMCAAMLEVKNPPLSKTVVVRTKERGTYSYKHAELPVILDLVRPVLGKHGLFLSQVVDVVDGKPVLRTCITYKSGACVQGHYPLPPYGGQEMGKEITYARRYAICAMLGIAGEDDTDADIGATPEDRKERVIRDEAVEKMSAASLGNRVVLDYLASTGVDVTGARTLDDLAVEHVIKLVVEFDECVAWAKQPREKTPPRASTPAESQKPKAPRAAPPPPPPPPAKREAAEGPDVSGMMPALAELMVRDGITKPALRAYYEKAKHQPPGVMPEDLPESYVRVLIQPDKWSKAVKTMKGM